MKNGTRLVDFALNCGLLALGALLFALGFPSFISDWGWAPFAWICLIPVVLLIRRIPFRASPLWGMVYGYVTYMLFNFWLAAFNPVSFVIVPTVYAGYFFVTFPLLHLADRAFGRWGWAVQVLVWAAYEILRTKGFLGYSYGVLGYSQYRWLSLISIADILGVMGVGILVAFPSFFIGGYLLDIGFLNPSGEGGFSLRNPSSGPEEASGSHSEPGLRWAVPAGLWTVLLLAANIYGLASKADYADSPTWRPALVQHNVNTWLSDIEAWQIALDSLLEESEKALEEEPDAIIWPETAFVPAIEWHERYRRDRDRVELIQQLKGFLAEQDIPVIIGNNDAVREAGRRQDFNAVLLFDGAEIVDKYRKIHLVPFSEHFPHADTMPWLMRYIQSQGTPLYGKGEEYSVFSLDPWGGPDVSPFICFEDTFGYLARNFVREGAEVLVNVTNDSWSPEAACAMQHMGMSIFRSVENRRTIVRSTTAGMTAVIDPNGRLLEILPPFTQGHIVADVPVYTEKTTIHTRYGDWFDRLILIAAGPLVISAAVLRFMQFGRRRKKGRR